MLNTIFYDRVHVSVKNIKGELVKLKLIIIAIVISIIIITMHTRNNSEKEIAFNENEKISEIFDKNNIVGTFVIYNPKNKILIGYNSDRA